MSEKEVKENPEKTENGVNQPEPEERQNEADKPEAEKIKGESGEPKTEAKEEDDINWEDGKEDTPEDSGLEGSTQEKDKEGLVNLQERGTETEKKNLDFILDIPLQITVELGRTRMLINELLQLGQGSIIELNKLAGEPMEVYVNDKLVARGEVVVVNEKFAIRLTDIVSPMERVENLK